MSANVLKSGHQLPRSEEKREVKLTREFIAEYCLCCGGIINPSPFFHTTLRLYTQPAAEGCQLQIQLVYATVYYYTRMSRQHRSQVRVLRHSKGICVFTYILNPMLFLIISQI